MLEHLLKYVSSNSLFDKGDKILIAVSGGLDSVVLLDLLFKTGFNISIAHCNFQLRGQESDMDEEFVKGLGEKYKLKTFVKICDASEYAKTNKLSIQESARELRYQWFKKVLIENKFDKLVVAHHFDDNLETFFINFSRGSGLSGLKGIPVKNDNIVRPLMFASRKEIEEYANENKLKFREDSSNSSDKYLRNNIRHNLIPGFLVILGGTNETLRKSMAYLAEDELLFEQLIQQKRLEIIEESEGFQFMKKSKLLSLSPLKTWVYYLLKPFGFSRSVTDDISEGLLENNTGKNYFSSTHRILSDREKLIITTQKPDTKNQEFTIDETVSELLTPLHFDISTFSKTDDFKILNDKNIAYFDFEILKFPLTLRKWETGDKFKPYGMKGSKLLSDFFIDEKLSLLEKENIWLLLSGEEIIWVVGLRTSDKYKITGQTETVYKVILR